MNSNLDFEQGSVFQEWENAANQSERARAKNIIDGVSESTLLLEKWTTT